MDTSQPYRRREFKLARDVHLRRPDFRPIPILVTLYENRITVLRHPPVAARGALRALKPRAAPWRRVEGRRGSMVDIVSWLQLNSQVRSQGQKAVERVGRPLFFPCNATSILLVVYGSEP